MRLIDADAFRQQIAAITIANGYDPKIPNLLCKLIDLQPVAYDAGKVMEQLEEKAFTAECYNEELNGCIIGNLLCLGDVYDIVKGGGKDE